MIKGSRVALLACALAFVSSRVDAADRKGMVVRSISPTQRVLTLTNDDRSIVALAGGEEGAAPYTSFPFIADGSVSYTVRRENPAVVSLDTPLSPQVDSAEGGTGIAVSELDLPGSDGVVLKEVGIMRRHKVYSLIVTPYEYTPSSKKLTYYRTVTIGLTSTQPFPSGFDRPESALSSKIFNRVQSNPPIPTGSTIRIVVNAEGIYHVTGYDLDTAGANISSFTVQNMTLWNHGKQIPIYVYAPDGTHFTSDSYLEFYGTPNLVDYSGGRPDLYADPFTDRNIYFLTDDSAAPPQRLVTESGALNRVPNATDLSGYSFSQTVHLERDNKFERLDAVDRNLTFDRRDHWFWAEVSSNQMVTLPFYLSYPDTTSIQPLTLTAAFHGISHLDGQTGSPNVPNENQAEVFINQTHVLSTTWDSQTMRIAGVGSGANIPQSVLHHGANNLQVYDANPGNIAVATFAFNWIELTYQRLYVADKDYIRFSVPDNAQPGYYNFLIQNFKSSTISVYRLNASRITDVTIRYINTQGTRPGYAALFQAYAQSPDDQFIAVGESGKLKPVAIEVVPNAGLASHDYSADYIMIVSRQLDDIAKGTDPSNPVSQLAAWYDSHGTKTLVVDAVQVYDDFNYGVKSPYAIKSFISYAYHNWFNPPKYVLLVGRGTWDTKNGHDASNLVPVMLMQTYTFGATSADNFYACVDGDDPIPDLAVGRIPATTTDQVKTTVDKILSCYSNKSFGWQNAALLIAGEEFVFHTQTDSVVRSMIPPNFFIKRLYTSIQNPSVDTKYYGTTQDLLNYFNQGTVLVNYMGHGGGAIWADNGILTNDEVNNLSNSGKYPFVTSMTCFAGAFDGQEGQPLSSTLLFAQDKGAVGLLASAGLGWLLNDFYMDGELIPLIFDTTRSHLSIGEDVMAAKARYLASYSGWQQAITMLNQYNVIGDPAFVLQLPPNNSTVRLNSYTVAAGQNISGTIENGPAGGTGSVQVTNLDGDVAAQTNVTLNSSGSGSFNIPFQGGFTGPGHVKAYAYNSSSQSASSVDITTGSSIIQLSSFGITSDGSGFRLSIGALATAAVGISSASFVGKAYTSERSTGDVFVSQFSIPLSASGGGGYSGTGTFGADTLRSGYVIVGNLEATLSDGSTTTSPQQSFTVPGASDLSAFPPGSTSHVSTTLRVVADTSIRLEAMVYDLNRVAARDVRVDFYDGPRGSSGTFIGSSRVSFDTTTQELVSTPANLAAGNHEIYIYIVLDSLTTGYDLHPENDYASGEVEVTLAAANSSGMVAVDSSATLSGASPGEIFDVAQVSVQLYPQPYVFPARRSDGTEHFYQFLSLRNPGGSYTVSLKIYDPDSVTRANLAGLHLYRYDARSRTINLVGGSYAGGVVTANVTGLGAFVAAFSSDHSPPQVTVSVGDQFFTNGDFVPPNPRFSFLLHDEDGLNLDPKSMNFQIDGQKVDTSSIVLPDSVMNPTSVTATLQLSLKDGPHTLVMTSSDANGNVSSPLSIDFVVQSGFSLRVFGSYPDPFIDRTFIAFEVTSSNPIDAVEVKIYTVSGRLVRTIRYPSSNPNETIGLLQGGTGSPTSVGYHEAWWDGTDNFGNQVSNGVYFYKVSVSSGGKTVQDIGKMARLR